MKVLLYTTIIIHEETDKIISEDNGKLFNFIKFMKFLS